MLAKVTVSLFFILLVWGNVVSGLGAGLACPDWPLCHGKLIPPLRSDIFMEWMHRNIGLIASIFLLLLSYRRFKSYRGKVKLIPILTVLLLLAQVVLGGRVVLSELPVDLTTIHFAIALIIFSLVFYMAFFSENKGTLRMDSPFFLIALMVFIQSVLGAYVRHSGAGLACPDWPTCLGYWIPPELSGSVLIHFIHRTLGYIIFALALLFFALSFLKDKNIRLKSFIILALVTIQILVGVGIVHSKLFFLTTAFHLAIALTILLVSLYSWFQEVERSNV
ncbi:Heme A synthase [bacterium HR37]|nr:Heme A synthase [bacterium HR37]